VTDNEMDDFLKSAALPEVEGAVVDRITGKVLSSLEPVRRLPSAGVIALGLVFVLIVVATFGATFLGFSQVLSVSERVLIFWLVGSLAAWTAAASAAAMVPGSRSRLDPRILLAIGTAAFFLVFPILFHDYRFDRFFSEGISCLLNGLFAAAVAGVLLWLVVRRGVFLNPPAAGVAIGTLAGLAGLAMLELHCPILKAMHLMVWHTAVIPLSALVGYLIGRWAQDLGVKRKAAEFMQ